MNIKKKEEEIVNYRLEKINKIKKKPSDKGFSPFFDEKNISINSSNIDNSFMSSRIFNKSVNKKNVTLRMLDFEENFQNQMGVKQNDELISRIKYLSFLIYIISFLLYKNSLFNCDNLILNDCIEKYDINIILICLIKCVLSGLILSANIAFIIWKLLSTLHIFILLIFIIVLLMLDYENNIKSHGLINFTILITSLIFGLFFFVIFQLIITSFIQKNYKNCIALITIIITVASTIFLYI